MGVYTDKKTGRLFVQFAYQGETYKFRLPEGTTKKAAGQLETKKKSELFFESHGITERKDTLYEDFLVEVYLPFIKANRCATTLEQAKLICKDSLRFLKGKGLRAIKPADIEKFKDHRAKLPTIHGRRRKPSTLTKELSHISKLFSMAIRNDLCDYNPCSRVEKPVFDNVQNKVLRREDEDLLFSKMHSDWARDICRLVLNTGLRQNDVMNLTRFSVDLAGGSLRLVQGKTKRTVEIPINEVVREILTRRLTEAKGSLLFASPKTGKVGGSVRHAMQRACDRAGIARLTIRDLRRSFGTRLHESAFDDSTVAQLLGHTDLRSVHRYKRGSEIKKRAVDSLVENSATSAKSLPAGQKKKASAARKP